MKPELIFLVVVALVGVAAGRLLEPGDFVALQSIRRALRDGPGSTFFSSWDFTADPCAFPGVLCDGDRIVALRLGEQRAGSLGLMGRLDAALGHLDALLDLSLAPGRVTGPIPATLGQLTRLRFLGLSRNLLSGAIPPSISSLRRIQTVDLSFNLLSGAVPPDLGQIPSLANLVLSHNLLSGPVPSLNLLSSSLLRLDLKNNNLSGELPALSPTVQYLSVSSNKLSGPLDRALVLPRQLRYVDLARNQLSGTIPSSIFALPATHLRLERNMFYGKLDVRSAVAIPNVDLSFNRISGELPAAFSSVRRLFLNNNLFVGKVPASLIEALKSSRMSALYLNHNFLTGLENDAMAGEIPSGSSLCLRYNCMEPPAGTDCPASALGERTRPPALCAGAGRDEDLMQEDPS
ncbi:uncharacterized protein LOC144711023 [Wolffia australiana]